MIARRQLETRLAGHVDRDSILWLASTDLGRLFARHNDRLLRELPVRVPADPAMVEAGWQGLADGPMDRVLLRGQIDAALPLESGLIVADYKTDRFEGLSHAAGSPRREQAESAIRIVSQGYRRQLDHYCRALRQITGIVKISVHLVLLAARHIETL